MLEVDAVVVVVFTFVFVKLYPFTHICRVVEAGLLKDEEEEEETPPAIAVAFKVEP